MQKGKSGMGANKRTAEYTGGGGAIGAIIGAIAGGGKGAAIGAGSGAAAGAITQVVTKGGSIKVPAETVLTFKLDGPLRVAASQ
jgi:outer membrane lipoprotein SlyB